MSEHDDLFRQMDALAEAVSRVRQSLAESGPENRHTALDHIEKCMKELGIMKAFLLSQAQLEVAGKVRD
jgi:hypothetical protein